MNSMTGYGYTERIDGSTEISVEFRSVNSRFLDLNITIPSFMNPLELDIRQRVSAKIARGKLDLTIRLHENNAAAVVTADTDAAVKYRDEIAKIAAALGKSADDIPLSLIIAQEGVLNISHRYDPQVYWQKVEPVFNEAFTQFLESRTREGAKLEADLLAKLDTLDSCAASFRAFQPEMEGRFKETITAKFRELVGDRIDENKILEETAAMLIKYTINEEIVRLSSHLEALRHEIQHNPVPGKRLDFFCQEANREVNTIGSKNQFAKVSQLVVTAKDALENIREQAKNVE
ncbi:MAG: YicC family protein [Treponema sp.]|nr:YicC family protein [Treponema sp.]